MRNTTTFLRTLVVTIALAQLSGCVLGCLIPALPGAWQENTDFGSGLAVLQSRDGGYVVLGEGSGGDHYTGAPYLLKTDTAGRELWSVDFSAGPVFPSSVVEADDGSLIVAGKIGWQFEEEEGPDVARISAEGEILWSRQIGEGDQDTRYGGHLVACSDGNFVSTSYTGSNEGGDVRIVKFDLVGDTVWTRVLKFAAEDYLADVAATEDGGVSLLTGDLLLRLASDGAEVWRVAPSLGNSRGQHLAATKDDGVVAVSFGRIVAFDVGGAVVWDKAFIPAGGAYAMDFHGTPDGGFLAGSTSGFVGYCRNMAVIKIDEDGDIVWQREYGTPEIEILDGLAPTSDDGFVLLGSNGRGLRGFVNYMFLMKVDGDE